MITVQEYQLDKDEAKHGIQATKITFFNGGDIIAWVGLVPVPPGAVYQVNYEHPHVIHHAFPIRFDTSIAPVSVGVREEFGLIVGPRLVIQLMKPEL